MVRKSAAMLLSFIFLQLSYAFQVQPERFVVNTKASSIQWIAGKVGGEHRGQLKLTSGSLVFNGTELKAGAFAVDMRSLVVSDLKGSSAQNLLSHLKSEDFFDVQKHPVASFTITGTSKVGDVVNITGNLTIKGITNSITFPATIKKQNTTLTATAYGVKINRTLYDIKYRSLSFFSEIGDKAIDDEFQLNIKLVVTRDK